VKDCHDAFASRAVAKALRGPRRGKMGSVSAKPGRSTWWNACQFAVIRKTPPVCSPTYNSQWLFPEILA
jgi:hypothetical protein